MENKELSLPQLEEKLSAIIDSFIELESSIEFPPPPSMTRDDFINYQSEQINLELEYDSIFKIIITKELDITNEYFEYSSLDNYRNKLIDLLNNFKGHYNDSNNIDFYKDQIIGYQSTIPYNLEMRFKDKICLKTKTIINYSQKRKIEFLNELIEKENPYKNKGSKKPKIFASTKNNSDSENDVSQNNKGLLHKWYALFYWIKLNAHGNQPPRNDFDEYKASEIKLIGKKIIEEKEKDLGTTTGGQGFYKQVSKVKEFLNDQKQLKSNFGNNWKEKIIELSNNDKTIIEYIKEKYPS